MSDFDDQARAASESVRRHAAELAAATDPRAGLNGPDRSASDRPWARPLLLAVACVAVLALGVGGLALSRGSDAPASVDTVAPTSPATSVDQSIVSAPAGPPTSDPPAAETTGPVDTAGSEPEPITRPVVDPEICRPWSAQEGTPYGLPGHADGPLPFILFARPAGLPIPIQIIGDPVDGQAKPFAMVLRHFDRDTPTILDDPITINGVAVDVSTFPNGNGEAEWVLADGSQGYLRSRGLDHDSIIAILTALTPRDAKAPIPGFDYAGGRNGLELVAEQLNDIATAGFAGSQCVVEATGYFYRVGVFTGDPAYTFGAVIDRPPPVDVGVEGDTTIVISGVDDPSAPRVSDVHNVDQSEWRELLAATEFEGAEPAHLIGGNNEVTVELFPVGDGSTPVSWLTLKLEEAEGVGVLEIHTADAVNADGAEYTRTEINGRIRGRSGPLHVGSVLGFALGDWPVTEPFTVTFSTTDRDDFTMQTTGEVSLVPFQD